VFIFKYYQQYRSYSYVYLIKIIKYFTAKWHVNLDLEVDIFV